MRTEGQWCGRCDPRQARKERIQRATTAKASNCLPSPRRFERFEFVSCSIPPPHPFVSLRRHRAIAKPKTDKGASPRSLNTKDEPNFRSDEPNLRSTIPPAPSNMQIATGRAASVAPAAEWGSILLGSPINGGTAPAHTVVRAGSRTPPAYVTRTQKPEQARLERPGLTMRDCEDSLRTQQPQRTVPPAPHAFGITYTPRQGGLTMLKVSGHTLVVTRRQTSVTPWVLYIYIHTMRSGESLQPTRTATPTHAERGQPHEIVHSYAQHPRKQSMPPHSHPQAYDASQVTCN